MDKRTFVGLCAALAFAAGSPAVHALKIADTTAPADRTALTAAADSFTYAAETLLTTEKTTATAEGDSTTYYNVGGSGDLVLAAPADIAATAGDTYIVSITLDGMVFRGDQLVNADLGGGSFTRAEGGGRLETPGWCTG